MARLTILLVTISVTVAAGGYQIGLALADDLPFPTDRPVSNSRTMTAIAVAQQLLPDGGCEPRFYLADLPADKLGYAISAPGVCVSWITAALAFGHGSYAGWKGRVMACGALVHEALHELGYRSAQGVMLSDGTVDHNHSPDSRSVMWPLAGGSVVWGCYRRFVPRGKGAAFRRDFPGLPWATFP